MVVGWLLKQKFFRFVFAGGLNYVIIAPTTYILTEYVGMYYFYAYALAFSAMLVFNFFFSLRWIFNVSGRMRDRIPKYLVYLVAFYCANITLVKLFTEFLHVYYIISITMVTGGLFILKYFTYKSQVFYEAAP